LLLRNVGKAQRDGFCLLRIHVWNL
jgi:hypothetical protein